MYEDNQALFYDAFLISTVLFAAGAYILADIKVDVNNKEDADIQDKTAQRK